MASDTSRKIGDGRVSPHAHPIAGDATTAGAADAPAIALGSAPAIALGSAPADPGNGGAATTVFNSLGDSQDDAWNPGESVEAQSFSTGAGSTTVTDVQLSLLSGDPNDGGHVTVDLLSNSGNSPGTLVATLGTIADSALANGSFATNDLTVTDAGALTADTRYWIEVTATTGNVNWGATDSVSGTEVSSEFMDANGIVGQDGVGGVQETFLMLVATSPACFAAGTRIRTARGDVPVESLREGDAVLTAREGGRRAPVRWIGHRRVAPARHPRPWDVNPIRVRAGALGPGQPSRDLLLSPDHALFLDGLLVRARDLLNGATVVQEAAERITYFHVELDRHDVLFAEGAPAESFLDTGNRAAFDNGGAAVMAHPEFARAVRDRDACAPLVWRGPALADVRARVVSRAYRIGWALTEQPDLRAIAGGRTIRPAGRAGALAFALPAGADRICLRSRSAVPAYVLDENSDTRALGVAVARLALDGAALPLDSGSLGAGWLPPEAGLRWTDGAAMLRTNGARSLELGLAGVRLRYWLSPDEADAAVLAACAA
jgi:hypothetical protein